MADMTNDEAARVLSVLAEYAEATPELREALRLAQAALQLNWISVSDKLPDKRGWYIGLWQDKVQPLRFDGDNWQHLGLTRDCATPSRWMSLPPTPEPSVHTVKLSESKP